MDVESSGIRSVGMPYKLTIPAVNSFQIATIGAPYLASLPFGEYQSKKSLELKRTERLNDSTKDFDCEYEHTLRKINRSSMLS